MTKLVQYGAKNLYKMETNKYTIWFSYETAIAFQAEDTGRISNAFVAKNIWSNTTGKHLGIVKRELINYVEVEHNVLLGIIEDCI